jgi:hypothetical protein
VRGIPRDQGMTHRGRVKNGVVVLDDPKALAEGTEVSVRPVQAMNARFADTYHVPVEITAQSD